KNKKIIAKGYHKEFGGSHAEVDAINQCSDPAGATLYVNLEPCDHQGKTPPCTDLIIKSGIKEVVIAKKDPKRNGIEKLESAGIKVTTGILEEEAAELNKKFFLTCEKKRPFITLKAAISIDGKIAKKRTEQTWLTGEESSKYAHQLRAEHQGILLGSGTVNSDNPHLGVRHNNGNDPLRIILAGENAIPKDSKIFRDENYLISKGKNLNELMQELYEQNIHSILVEGGARIYNSFIKEKLVDEYIFLIAPKVLGKNSLNFSEFEDELPLEILSMQKLGQDMKVHAKAKWDSNNG
ncbi:bifunctional diaminohydroxyphosphoribosylaminopyrimidine deaminase/5-amino-6-(5-phosphoribosylamino)uracil reductase RibD, partial [Candidatus Peregrinibacteria bacterium]|nr:bifunctional diaminohydroxyphosphoribosylaminopyrimidine deaminase/5-amino-6-(5-phosphoribosylamino)uracil reductase RibD [Candidatus Peregrinibacteria bacterium]